jgi:hypothetical protein
MFWPSQNRFIFQYQRDRKQQFKLLIQSSQQKQAGSASVTPQCCNYNVNVENVRSQHSYMILQAISQIASMISVEVRVIGLIFYRCRATHLSIWLRVFEQFETAANGNVTSYST